MCCILREKIFEFISIVQEILSMGLRSLYVDKITPLLKRIPGGSRLNAALVAFSADLRLYSAPYGTSASNRFYTDQEIEAIFKRLDKASIELAIRFMHRQIAPPRGGCFVHPEYFFSQQEKEEFKRNLKRAALEKSSS